LGCQARLRTVFYTAVTAAALLPLYTLIPTYHTRCLVIPTAALQDLTVWTRTPPHTYTAPHTFTAPFRRATPFAYRARLNVTPPDAYTRVDPATVPPLLGSYLATSHLPLPPPLPCGGLATVLRFTAFGSVCSSASPDSPFTNVSTVTRLLVAGASWFSLLAFYHNTAAFHTAAPASPHTPTCRVSPPLLRAAAATCAHCVRFFSLPPPRTAALRYLRALYACTTSFASASLFRLPPVCSTHTRVYRTHHSTRLRTVRSRRTYATLRPRAIAHSLPYGRTFPRVSHYRAVAAYALYRTAYPRTRASATPK